MNFSTPHPSLVPLASPRDQIELATSLGATSVLTYSELRSARRSLDLLLVTAALTAETLASLLVLLRSLLLCPVCCFLFAWLFDISRSQANPNQQAKPTPQKPAPLTFHSRLPHFLSPPLRFPNLTPQDPAEPFASLRQASPLSVSSLISS